TEECTHAPRTEPVVLFAAFAVWKHFFPLPLRLICRLLHPFSPSRCHTQCTQPNPPLACDATLRRACDPRHRWTHRHLSDGARLPCNDYKPCTHGARSPTLPHRPHST